VKSEETNNHKETTPPKKTLTTDQTQISVSKKKTPKKEKENHTILATPKPTPISILLFASFASSLRFSRLVHKCHARTVMNVSTTARLISTHMYLDTTGSPSTGFQLKRVVEKTDCLCWVDMSVWSLPPSLSFWASGGGVFVRDRRTATHDKGKYIIVSNAIDLIWVLSRFVSSAIMVLTCEMRVLVTESCRAIWFHPCESHS